MASPEKVTPPASNNTRTVRLGPARVAAYSLVVTVVCLLLLEFAARLVEPAARRELRDFQVETALSRYRLWQQTLFRSFGGVHQPDPNFLWTMRPNLRQPLLTTNSRGLLGREEIPYEKPPNTIRILLVGNSSPVGLGLRSRDEAFGERTAVYLQRERRGLQQIELINAAVSGYTSEQVRRLVEQEGLRYSPDVVVCYLGNNDGSINGYLSDAEIFAAQEWAQSLRTILYRSALYRMLRGLLSPVLRDFRGEQTTPKVRVSVPRFAENLTVIGEAASAVGAHTVFVNPPVPYRWPAGLQFKLFSEMTDQRGQLVMADPLQRTLARPVAYCIDSTFINRPYGKIDPYVQAVFASAWDIAADAPAAIAEYQAKLEQTPDDVIARNNLGVVYWRTADYGQAREQFTKCLLADSSLNVARYNLGITVLSAGDSTAAWELLAETIDRDAYSLRIKTPYRQAIHTAADACGGTVFDAADLFWEAGNEHLFIDHCHPTPEGHRLIAESLANVIDSLLQQGLSQ